MTRRRHNPIQGAAPQRRGFTLIEVMVALIITSFVLGAIWTSVGRLIDARSTSRARMGAYLRADNALNTIRQSVASTLRSDDLYWTKFRIFDDIGSHEGQIVPRDDLLVFTSRLRMERPLTDQGEGIEYESQFRVQDDAQGSVLWQRRDPVPDETYDGGGVVTPLIDHVVGFNVEAYDGEQWFSFWESDEQGLPHSVRITIMVAVEDQPYAAPITLQTTVAIDRVPPPFDAEDTLEEDDEADTAVDQGTQDTGAGGTGGASGGGSTGGGTPTRAPGGQNGRTGGGGGGPR